MPCTMPRSVTVMPSGTLVSAMMWSMRVGDAAQVLAERTHVDIDDAANLVVVHFGGRLDARDGADRVQRAVES